MDLSRLAAAACAVTLHAAVIVGAIGFARAPSLQALRPIEVVLIEAPAAPISGSPAAPTVEPARSEPAPAVEPARIQPAPAPKTVPPKRKIAPTRRSASSAAPPRTVADRRAVPPTPVPPVESRKPDPAPPEAADDATSDAASDGIAASPTPRPTERSEGGEAVRSPSTITATGPTAASPATAPGDAAPRRTAPRIDASWRGNVPPPYPNAARRMGDQGEVRLDVHVGADGSVLEVRLRQSSGSPLLDRASIDTVKRWHFTPATVDGKPVAAWYHEWRWVFRLEG